MRSGRPEFSILSSAIDVVERHGQLGRLNHKVKLQHPSDKPHQSQYDARVRDALTEACAFAWADLRGLGPPILSDAEGAPDVQLDTGVWVEAKAIHNSDEDAERIEEMLEGREAAGGNVRPAGPGLFNKLDSAFDDAAKKFSRVDSSGEIVFFNITAVDLPQLAAMDLVLDQLAEWAENKESPESTTRIVICYAYNWKEPIRDPFAI